MDVSRARTIRVLSECALIAAAVAVLDAVTPLGTAAPLPYVLVVLVALQFYRPSLTFLAAGICTVLTVVGFWLSEDRGASQAGAVNRGLVIGVLWVTALLSRRMTRLSVSGQRLATIVDSTDDAIIGKTVDGIITDWNRGAERLYGYTAEEAVGRSISLILPPERAAEGADLLDCVRRGERVAELETTRVTKSGRKITIQVTISPMHDASGRIVGASAIARDISERRKAEEMFRLAVESSPSGMLVVNSEGMIVFANSEAERQFGYTRDELVGNPIEMLVPARFRDQHFLDRAAFQAAPQTRAMGAGRELFGLRKDGGEFPVEIGLNPMIMEGRPMVLSAVVDVSERRRVEEMFRLAVESSPSGMVMVDSEGKIVFANSEAERLFGYTRDELVGNPIEMLVPERFRHQHSADRAAFQAAPQTRAMGAGRELFGLRKDGGEFPVEIGLNPITMHDRPMVLSAVVDVSERRHAEEAQRRASDELTRKNEELEQFVYTVSHDLKTPLVTLQGFSSHLRKDISQKRLDRLEEFAQRIEGATGRMQAIIHDLLAIGRVGRVEYEPEEVDLGELVRVWLSENQTLVAGESVELQEPLPIILFDRQRLWEVVDNLLTNAVKYGCTNPGPKVRIGWQELVDEVHFCVEDNGTGIAEKYKKRIFELFQRLHRDHDGTGVGLALVKRVIEHAGGRVWVEDPPIGQGARFIVALPKRLLRTSVESSTRQAQYDIASGHRPGPPGALSP